MNAKLFNENHDCSQMQTITKRSQMSTEDMECVRVLRGRKRVVVEGGAEARNEVAPLQRFLNNFQRPTSQLTETKTTLTSGRAIRKTRV